MDRFATCLLFTMAWFGLNADPGSNPLEAKLVEVQKIWDRAPHNAFTDLRRFNGRWFCVFREGQAHVSPDGVVRVITSRNGRQWRATALLSHPNADLRDPKITITPQGQLMLSAAAAFHQPHPVRHQTFAWFSKEGTRWSDPVKIGEPNFWLWRVTWQKKIAYGIGYETTGEKLVRLYTSKNGKQFDPLVRSLFAEGQPNETSLLFLPNDRCLCLLRRDGPMPSAQLGFADPPYTQWGWKDLGTQIGGPHLARLPGGRIIGVVRLYAGGARTSLISIDPAPGTVLEILRLPSGGDTSYAGLVWRDQRLWVSYYSSHEGKASIYLAQVKLTF